MGNNPSAATKEKNRLRAAKFRSEHPELNASRQLQVYRSRLAMIHELKSSKPCLDCGRYFPPECMDFDHVRGEKLFNVGGGLLHSLSSLIKEIEKCIVCANCHRIRTFHRV